MFVLITYDVNTESEGGKKRLRKVAKECEKYGQRVQCSVFECVLEPAQYEMLKSELTKIMNMEKDSVRFYSLGQKYETKIQEFGRKREFDHEGILLF
ncbi:MAG: CRISPR-associated endonuclease Cas2 [Butyrivibrio sp.]|jgi:CRISPR-associated protein Cas2|nr:CRISPR-associated endonuclease Cas2 [Butyrivibrio sp.]